nr:GNAT family N-acetyltransferase [Candidatus Sigynarchaeota archaeon]
MKPVIVPLSGNDALDLAGFSCDKPDMEEWIRNKAKLQDEKQLTKIFIVVLKHAPIAIIALYCSHLRYQPPGFDVEINVPGICIGQLAVQPEYKNKGLGKNLIQYSIAMAIHVNKCSACRVLHLWAHDDVVEYYRMLHFTPIRKQKGKTQMFFDLADQ